MTEPTKTKERIPFESLDQETPVSAWQLPPMHVGGKLVRSASREKNNKKNSGGASEAIETVAKNSKPKQLTADDLQKITEEARREGFQQGLHEGTEQGILEGTKAGLKSGEQRAYNDAKKDIQALQNQLRQISTRLFDPMQQQEIKIENILVDLVLNLSKRVIADELSVRPEVLVALVDKVLQSIPKGAKHTRVFLNEKDASLLESLVPESQRDWLVQRDQSLASGGCRVETDSSLVDFSVEERLASYLDKIDSLDGVGVEIDSVPDYQADYQKAIVEHSKQEEALIKTAQIKGELESEELKTETKNALGATAETKDSNDEIDNAFMSDVSAKRKELEVETNDAGHFIDKNSSSVAQKPGKKARSESKDDANTD